MARDLSGMRVAILTTDGVQWVGLDRSRGAAGADTELLSIHAGEVQARHFDLVPAGTFSVDEVDEVNEQVVVDGQFIISRSAADLAAFWPAVVEQFADSRVRRWTRTGSCRPDSGPESSTSEGDSCESCGVPRSP
jgi:hypothetical protein